MMCPGCTRRDNHNLDMDSQSPSSSRKATVLIPIVLSSATESVAKGAGWVNIPSSRLAGNELSVDRSAAKKASVRVGTVLRHVSG
eukprot:2067770-Amphidinium_carterae.1